jgi:hypothetical protein
LKFLRKLAGPSRERRVRFTNPISPAAASAGNLRGAGYGRVA